MPSDATASLTLAELRQLVQAADPAAILVEPRILRRVIKQDRRMAGLALFVPHRKTYVIQRERLLVIASRAELNVAADTELPNKLILLADPSDDEPLDVLPRDDALYLYWRFLFHAQVHVEMEKRVADGALDAQTVFERIREIGLLEFEEIRSVLQKDAMLLSPQDDQETYIEFVAVYLELRYFAEADLPLYFPAIRDWDRIRELVSHDLKADDAYHATRLHGAPTTIARMREVHEFSGIDEADQRHSDPLQPSPPQYWRLLARAERQGALGNGVKAAILRTRAARLALPDRVPETKLAAQAEIARLAGRLRDVLQLSTHEVQQWIDALQPLLEPASRGFIAKEARFLYDLQKVCVEHERGVYSIDLIEYVWSLGRRPLRRRLPLLREVLITKHLRTANYRLASARVSVAARERIAALLESAVDRIECQLRERIRPSVTAVMDSVGLIPNNVPERVARRKLIEELLDGIVENGFITMGHLRDALSRNNLKLPDVAGVKELLRGDQLLRADRLLKQKLDGVYRAGAIYLRIPQTLSSLAFGTNYGRIVTQFVILPFGGSFLALEFLRHMLHSLVNAFAAKPPAAGPRAGRGSGTIDDSGADRDATEPVSPTPADSSADPLPPTAGDDQVMTETNAVAAIVNPDDTTAEKAPPDSQNGSPDNSVTAEESTSPSDFLFPIDPPGERQAVVGVDSTTSASQAGQPSASLGYYGLVFLVGCLVLALIHRPAFRKRCLEGMLVVWRSLRLVLFDIPARCYRSRIVQRVLHSQFYAVVRNYLLRPAAFTMLFAIVARLWQQSWSFDATLNAFLGVNLFLNSPVGRYADEWVTDVVARTWHDVRMRIFGAVFQWVADVFHRLMENLERVLYAVDEWLRFRAGDSRLSVAYKAAMSVVWFAVTYVIRIYVTLLVEPQINPIKHFPVVTVSHKIMLPWSIVLTEYLAVPFEPFLGRFLANAFAGVTVFLMPGLFGFLVWELKENWRLYHSNRPAKLQPIRIGDHGESLLRLLRPGLHSGTAPKLFSRLRHSLRKAQRTGNWNAVNACRARRKNLERQVRRFVDREFCALLEEGGFSDAFGLHCGEVRVANSRFEFALRRSADIGPPLWIRFENHRHWLVASFTMPEWLQELNAEDTRRFTAAFVGLLQVGAVELLENRLRQYIGADYCWFHFSDTGVIVFPTESVHVQQHVPLLGEGNRPLVPQSGEIQVTNIRLPDIPILLSHTSVRWSDWVATWSELHDAERLPAPCGDRGGW
jgi:hypothetical protein